MLTAYLERYPQEAGQLAEPLRLLAEGQGFASRRTFPMHVTAGALPVRDGAEVLLIEHLADGLTLQPRGHVEPAAARGSHGLGHVDEGILRLEQITTGRWRALLGPRTGERTPPSTGVS
ncbi:hypothetical protein ACIA98_41775 [Streptomyces sp. NPDC051366]|uniref:hypothetical protein n=1 Tax=Streptomyces sp. NPDC051366 TaxID=3365652 RepID=UPI00379EFEA2